MILLYSTNACLQCGPCIPGNDADFVGADGQRAAVLTHGPSLFHGPLRRWLATTAEVFSGGYSLWLRMTSMSVRWKRSHRFVVPLDLFS